MPGSHPYLNQKFTPAVLPEVCAPRRALLADLYAAAEDGFVSITAPGGSGKTVTALLWLTDSRREPVWIGLDGYDNGLAVFYKLIATGLYSTQPDNENMRAIVEDPSFSASPVEHTVALISEIRQDGVRRALILDDMHLITNGEIFRSLPLVLRRLPHNFVTLVLSRTPLPEGFHILVKDPRDQITADKLRFTQGEIQEYFRTLGLFLTPGEAETAQIATDGWAISVNAVAQSGDFNVKPGGVFAQFFEENVWNRWDASLQAFCLKTCVVDEFDSELARRLSGRADAGDVMEELSLANAFISRLHDDTYRYHHLLSDFLRERLRREGGVMAGLCKIAANYYMERKDYSMALRFWLDSGDYKGADRFLLLFMFENHHGDIAGYVDFLRLYFIRDFPDSAFREFPALHVCCAWYYYMTGQYKLYERHADEGYRHIARIALYDPKFVEFSMLMYSVDHRSEMLDKVKRFNLFGKLVKGFTKDGIIRHIASFTHNLPYLHRSSFDYSESTRTEESVKKIERSAFRTLLGDQAESIISLAVAGAAYERNDLDAALAGLAQTGSRLHSGSSAELAMSAHFLYHSILLRMGAPEAGEELAALSAFMQTAAPFFWANLDAYKVKLKLMDADRAAARSWLGNYYVSEPEHIELYLLFQHFTTARAHLVMGDAENARQYISMLREFGLSLNRVCDYCEATALLAGLEWALGNKREGEALLTDVLVRLQRYGYRRMIIDEGAAVLPILKRIAARVGRPEYDGPLDREYVSALLLETHRFAKRHRGVTAHFTGSQKPVKLSKQQTKIVTLLSKGYSNAMIMAETGLKITTIKTHTALAYQKLGVNNSVDAVLKARELGLVEQV